MSRIRATDNGYLSGMMFVIAAVILFSLALLALTIPPSFSSGQDAYASLKILTDNLALEGTVTGYADLSTIPHNNPDHPAPSGYTGMNAMRFSLRLASLRMNWETGTGDDLSQATVVITTPQGSEILPRQPSGPFARPGWSIVQKGGLLPGTSANGNDLLEPNEVFSILLSPSANIPPETPFTVTISIPNVQPFTFERVVPHTIRPAMNLG